MSAVDKVKLTIIGFELITGGVLVAVISMMLGTDPFRLVRKGLSVVRTVAELIALSFMARLPKPRKTVRRIGRHRVRIVAA